MMKTFQMPQNRFYLICAVAVCLSKVIASVNANLLIAGSSNLDTFLRLSRLPQPGENLTLLPNTQPVIDIPGGKGCNQAIACKKLSSLPAGGGAVVSFLGRIGNDKSGGGGGGAIIKNTLLEHSVNIEHLEECDEFPTGRGYVFLEQDTGKVSAVVSGGSNMYGWGLPSDNVKVPTTSSKIMLHSEKYLDDLFAGVNCLLLQREIPEAVNFILAKHAKSMKDRKNSNIVVLQDIGGEERDMDSEMMSQCDYIMPNLTELKRLVKSLTNGTYTSTTESNKHDEIVALAKILQGHGAKNVLVTLAEEGSLLVKEDGSTVYQEAISLEQLDMTVVDETGAGDCYRAGFAVALMEKKSIQDCMEFASAAGAIACTKEGAVPSIPSRHEVEALTEKSKLLSTVESIPRGGGGGGSGEDKGLDIDDKDDEFPYFFGSRLNSMKDRPELWSEPVDNVREWVKRQGSIKGLGCVDFNYPQHFHDWDAKEAKKSLEEVGLKAGAVCLRYPSKFARGAMNHPDEDMRNEAIKITMEAAKVARELGCNEVVIWSAYDGYDYSFQVNYQDKWDQLIKAFQECCDSYPDIRWSLEFKPTDENTRFFTVPSTGAAMLLVKEINRENMGLTLDVGHMLMAGENPAQSISMVGNKLFGIQLNDGYTRLAAEDGMMFGSIHPTMALEIMYQLKQIQFSGHLYFDTFPQRSCPVREAEYNINSAKRFWRAACMLDGKGIRHIMDTHDAIGALNTINDVLHNSK